MKLSEKMREVSIKVASQKITNNYNIVLHDIQRVAQEKGEFHHITHLKLNSYELTKLELDDGFSIERIYQPSIVDGILIEEEGFIIKW